MLILVHSLEQEGVAGELELKYVGIDGLERSCDKALQATGELLSLWMIVPTLVQSSCVGSIRVKCRLR